MGALGQTMVRGMSALGSSAGWRSTIWLLAGCAALGAAASAPGPFRGNFTLYSAPVELRYGEVHNRLAVHWNQHGPPSFLPFPPGVVARYASGERTMALSGFSL